MATIFLSTPSARRATKLDDRISALERISIHALREEGDVQPPEAGGAAVVISIHALREEGDSIGYATFSGRSNFYPRPP